MSTIFSLGQCRRVRGVGFRPTRQVWQLQVLVILKAGIDMHMLVTARYRSWIPSDWLPLARQILDPVTLTRMVPRPVEAEVILARLPQTLIRGLLMFHVRNNRRLKSPAVAAGRLS